MELKFKNGIGIPLTDFQIKLNKALNLIGAAVTNHPNDPIVNVFASNKRITQGEVKFYYFRIENLIINNEINYKQEIRDINAFKIWARLRSGAFYEFDDELNFIEAK
jgi:hypothetical protein